jgi:hypothetical protein
MFAELNVKNKIIYDLRSKENWLTAEINASKKGGTNGPKGKLANGIANNNGMDDQDTLVSLEILATNPSAELDESKIKIFQSLFHFKKELERAKEAVEQVRRLLEVDWHRTSWSLISYILSYWYVYSKAICLRNRRGGGRYRRKKSSTCRIWSILCQRLVVGVPFQTALWTWNGNVFSNWMQG